jgi:hypothetical protein
LPVRVESRLKKKQSGKPRWLACSDTLSFARPPAFPRALIVLINDVVEPVTVGLRLLLVQTIESLRRRELQDLRIALIGGITPWAIRRG